MRAEYISQGPFSTYGDNPRSSEHSLTRHFFCDDHDNISETLHRLSENCRKNICAEQPATIRGCPMYIPDRQTFRIIMSACVGIGTQLEPTANSTLFCLLWSFLGGLRATVRVFFQRDFLRIRGTVSISCVGY